MGFSEYWNNHLAIQVESNKPLTELSCWDMPQPTLKYENNDWNRKHVYCPRSMRTYNWSYWMQTENQYMCDMNVKYLNLHHEKI